MRKSRNKNSRGKEMNYLVRRIILNALAVADTYCSSVASEMKRCDKIGELMEERQKKDKRELNKVCTTLHVHDK